MSALHLRAGFPSDGATVEDLGKVGKLPSELPFLTEEEKKSSACLLYKHLRGPGTLRMLELCGGASKNTPKTKRFFCLY